MKSSRKKVLQDNTVPKQATSSFMVAGTGIDGVGPIELLSQEEAGHVDRIVYRIDMRMKIIVVWAIGHRRDSYETCNEFAKNGVRLD